MDDINGRLSQNGFTLELYAQYNGMTIEQFESIQRKSAENSAKVSLILNEIGKREKLENFDAVLKFLYQKNKFISKEGK